MLRTTAIAKELAVIERKLQETTNKTLKDALKKKQARLKDELNDFKKSTPSLAKQLLAQRAQIKQLSKMDFNDLVRRLAKKPEYSFLKTLSKSTIKTDIERPAKPVGWRFKGRGNYDKPTLAEIKKGKRNGTVYREVRPLRSDVSQPLRLEEGGGIERKKPLNYKHIVNLIKGADNPKNQQIFYSSYSNSIQISSGMRGAPQGQLKGSNLVNFFKQPVGSSSEILELFKEAAKNPDKTKTKIESLTQGKIYVDINELGWGNEVIVKYKPRYFGDKMSHGGTIEIGDKVKASKEYGGKSGTVIDKRGSFVVVEYTNGKSDSYHESDVVKKMENGGNMKNTHMMEDGGVIGQEIVFDDNGEENTGVIKDIHEITGNYIVATDDGRTVLADKELDVISLGGIRKKTEAKKRFSFFEDGGMIKELKEEIAFVKKDKNWNSKQSKEEYIAELEKEISRLSNKKKLVFHKGDKIITDKGIVFFIEKPNYSDDYLWVVKEKGSKFGNTLRKSDVVEIIEKFEDGGNIAKENNEMLQSQAKEAKHHIEELHNIINNKTKVEPWVVAKMTRAKTDLSDITHYLEGASHKMAKGGKLTDEQQNKFDKVMHEWKQGKLHSGSANGPIVKDQDQAIAIAYSEAYGMDKMLFGGMVNDLSDDAIDRMEGLVPISTLGELLDNAKFIIADMYEEGFEKDEIMSFLAYKISQIGGAKNTNSSSSTPSRHKAQVLVDLYNELSDAKNIELLEWDYDADKGHFIIYENGLESTLSNHKGQNDQFTFYANDIDKINAVYILNGNTTPNLSVKEALKYARANEDVKMSNGGGVGESFNYIANLDDNQKAVYKRLKSNEYNDNNRYYTFYGRDIMSSKEYPNIVFISGIEDLYFKNDIDAEEYLLNKKYSKGGQMATGGGVGSLAPNLLMELWYAVWERKTDKYDEIAKKLDKEGVSFTIQNKVSEDAQNTRSRKAIDTFEVQDRIKKIMGNTKMAKGGGVGKIKNGDIFNLILDKNFGIKTEPFKAVVKVVDDEVNSRGQVTVLHLEGKMKGTKTDMQVSALKNEYAKGGGVGSKKQDYIEVTNGDTILSLEKTNGVWEEVDVLQGVKPVNFGRNTYKGNLDAEALVDALNKEYAGGYRMSYVFMNGGKMSDGGGVGLKTDSDIKKGDKEYITSGKYKSYLENKLEYLKKENVSRMYDWERKRHLDKIDDIEKIIDDLTHRPSKVKTVKYAKGGQMGWKHKYMA